MTGLDRDPTGPEAGPDGPIWAVVVAAGRGERFGAAKQFLDLGGRQVLSWAIDTVRGVADGVVVVVPADHPDPPAAGHLGCEAVVAGGETRSESVRAGLGAVPADAAVIVIHDAARPLASQELCRRTVAALATADAAIPALALADTVKRVTDGVVVATLDRSELVAVQTPQAFRAPVLRRAHLAGAEATDDAALVELVGGVVKVVPGELANAKVTTAEDLESARRHPLVKVAGVETGL